jgi:hypothetical protein
MYYLQSMKVAPVEGAKDQAYTIDVDASMNLSSSLSFWEDHQRFWVHRHLDAWRISAIGREPPPEDWEPQPPVVSAAFAAPAGFPTPVLPEQQARNALVAWLAAWVKGDAKGGMRFMTDQVRILRLDLTLNGDDLRDRMTSYFGGDGMQGRSARDLLAMDTAFVEPSQRFADSFSTPTYRLTVRTTADVSDSVPFWGEYQDFYFVQDRGAWKIFAIF